MSPLCSQTDSFNNLNSILQEMDESGERLSSGTLLWTDSPSSRAIYEKLESHIDFLTVSMRNDKDMISYYRSREGYLNSMVTALQRIRDLILQRSNSFYGPDEREIIDSEISIHYRGIVNELSQARFNRIPVFSSWAEDDLISDRFLEAEFYTLDGIDRILIFILREQSRIGSLINAMSMRGTGMAVESENTSSFQSHVNTDFGREISSLLQSEILLFSNLFLLDFKE